MYIKFQEPIFSVILKYQPERQVLLSTLLLIARCLLSYLFFSPTSKVMRLKQKKKWKQHLCSHVFHVPIQNFRVTRDLQFLLVLSFIPTCVSIHLAQWIFTNSSLSWYTCEEYTAPPPPPPEAVSNLFHCFLVREWPNFH